MKIGIWFDRAIFKPIKNFLNDFRLFDRLSILTILKKNSIIVLYGIVICGWPYIYREQPEKPVKPIK
jgi:hypothetical protein